MADVRKMRGNGRLYLVCAECGTIRPTGERFQDYILTHSALDGPGDVPEEPDPEPAPAPPPAKMESEPEPAQAPAPRRRGPGILSFLNDWEL